MKNIIWTKWCDPLLPVVNGAAPEPYDPEEDEENPRFHQALNSFGRFYDRDINSQLINPFGRDNLGPAIIGPVGIVPLRESNLPSRLFNFWMGDCDFDLDQEAAEAIAAVPGVETLDIFTRYRLRLGVGRAFNQEAVLKAVAAAVNPAPAQPPAPPAPPAPPGPLERVQAMLDRTGRPWAIRVGGNGKLDVFGGATKEEVLAKLGEGEGKVIYSWERPKP